MSTSTAAKPYGPLYRLVWRWHFYAGLAVAPFLVILAVTGAIYLFNDEINDLSYPGLRFVARGSEPVALGQVVTAAEARLPGAVTTRVDTPSASDRSVQVYLALPDGSSLQAFVDPYTGTVLGTLDYRRTLVGFADKVHGSLMLGDAGNAVLELMASWGAVLTVTGLYLWWPAAGRWRVRGVLWPRLTAGGRAALRDLHGVTGFWTALLILFLILTGLPWANLWGGRLVSLMETVGIGYPASYRGVNVPTSQTVKQAVGEAPWTVERTDMPASTPPAGTPAADPHAHHHGGGGMVASMAGAIGIDRAAAVLASQGMAAPYRLFMPRGTQGVYFAFTYPDRPQGQRTLYIDQYSGRVLRDVGFADYGWGAQAVELGVQLHLGNYFGRANQIVMLIPCLGIVLLCVTGPWMWWKRRPAGKLAAPVAPHPARLRPLALITLVLSALFPLAGGSLLLVLAGDRAVTGVLGRRAVR
ncbi:putative iron-regulated membrane protein [Nitrospirillum amazonense]|uniref:Putative iron-regulated membrane protein n=1 Tax=Nitrospirillum amazonense TaxID=28077 RepID=A0A560FP41_9PROT|nr:PepSY domain-containing protein [Nitrospirillum amazonense]TWB23398.1 putative iron-regulated membrane protein [Nitrospirillum amazonense]